MTSLTESELLQRGHFSCIEARRGCS